MIWHRNTSETLDWAKADAWLRTPYGQEWRVVFEGVRGASFTGDIAIDDVFYTNCYRKWHQLYNCNCCFPFQDIHLLPHDSGHSLTPVLTAETVCNITRGELQCGGPECYEVHQQCDFGPDCSDSRDEAMCGACDFEDYKMCGYTHDDTAEVAAG